MVDVAKEDHLTVQQRLVTEHVAQVQARLKGARPQTDPKASIKSRWWKIIMKFIYSLILFSLLWYFGYHIRIFFYPFS